MNKISINSAYRNIKKNKLLSIKNTLGLAFGITICLINFRYVAFELSCNKFNGDDSQFTIPFEGNSENESGKNEVIINISAAKKYFGNVNPNGKKLVVDGSRNFIASAVAGDF